MGPKEWFYSEWMVVEFAIMKENGGEMGGIIGSYGQSDLMRGNSGKQQEAGSLYQQSRGMAGDGSSFDVRGGNISGTNGGSNAGSGGGSSSANGGYGRVEGDTNNHGYGYVRNPEELKHGYGVVSESEKNRGYGVLSSGGERRGYGVTPGDGYKRGYGRLGGTGSGGGASGMRRAPSETMQRDKMMGMGGGPAGGAGFSGGSRPSGGNIRPVIKPNF